MKIKQKRDIAHINMTNGRGRNPKHITERFWWVERVRA
jgi:hypothetical protein